MKRRIFTKRQEHFFFKYTSRRENREKKEMLDLVDRGLIAFYYC